MAERDLSTLRQDLESGIEPPDFAVVTERSRRVRRRRRVAVAGAVALVAAVVGVTVVHPSPAHRSVGPVRQPHLPGDNGASKVLASHRVQVDPERSAVDGTGDVLAVLVVPPRGFAASSPCRVGWGSAYRWVGADGRTVTWSDRSTDRTVAPVPGGFVVGAVPGTCRQGRPGEEHAYLVSRAGTQWAVRWAPGTSRSAAAHCEAIPSDGRCHFDVDRGVGHVDDAPPAHRPAGSLLLTGQHARVRWAQSPDGRRIFRSTLGAPWVGHATSLPADETVSTTAAGDWAAFVTTSRAEYTADGGRTWHVRDLSSALAPIRVADVTWTITRTGRLIGVTTLVGRGDVLFRSTDASWTRFRTARVHTRVGAVDPQVIGATVYVPDDNGWVLSDDDGATWRTVDPLD